MLDQCMEGNWSKRPTKHKWWVTDERTGHTFRSLPLGAHGHRKAKVTTVEVGHVRKMAREFEILDCAKRQIAGL